MTGTKSKLTVMLEAEASNIDKELFLDGIYHGLEACQNIAECIEKESQKFGKTKRTNFANSPTKSDQLASVKTELSMLVYQKLKAIYSDFSHDKISRDKAAFSLRDSAIKELRVNLPEIDPSLFYEAFNIISRNLVAELIINDGIRVDGRKHNELRNIGCQVDLHEPLHGSALFQRGQTQVMCTVALDSMESALKSDAVSTLLG